MTRPTDPGTGTRQPWTVRVATWSARHRWPVFGLWFVLTIGLFVASLPMGGTRTADAVDDDREEQTTYEAARAYDLFGASGDRGHDPPDAARRGRSRKARSTMQRRAAALDDVLARMAAHTTDDRWRGRADVRGDRRSAARAARGRPRLAGPIDRPDRGRGARGRTRRSTRGSRTMRPFLDETRAAHPGLRIHSLDGTLANEDIQELVTGGLDASLRLTIPLTFLILLVAFGAAVAAIVPLVLAVTALLAAFGVLGHLQPGRSIRSARTRASSSCSSAWRSRSTTRCS